MIIATLTVLLLTGTAGLYADINWQYCVSEAAGNNAELLSAKERYKAAGYNLKSTYSLFLPQAEISMGSKLKESNPSANKYTASLTVSQNLFNGFDSLAQVRRSRNNVLVYDAALEETKAKISYDLKYVYSSLVYAQNAIKLQKDIVKRREENLKLVELRFDSGRENKGSVLLSRAYFNQAGYDLLQANNNLSVYRENLMKTLSGEQSIDTDIDEEIPASLPEKNPDFKTIALNTPEYKKAVAVEALAESELTMSRADFYPSLGLTGSYSKAGQTFFPVNESWFVGLNLTIPIFNSGRDYYAVKSAAADLRAEAFNRQDTLHGIMTNLKQAYSSYMETVEKVKVDESFLKAALARAEIARSKYNNGLITFDDWDIIENDLISRQKNLLSTRRERIIKEAAWEQIQGKGVLQ
ncbi:MAG: TolC family protein [Oligoflexia bacterium]|nr:TolC family protein [Oligoflexia bacterium]